MYFYVLSWLIEPRGQNNIYLDKVDNLPGHYVKIETALDENEKVSEVMEDLQRTMKLFHLPKKKISHESYFEMIQKNDIINAK